MAKVPTTPVVVTAECGERLTINLPVGPLDPPTAESERIAKAHQDPRGWKYPTRPYHTYDKSIADDLARNYDFYLGGHELTVVRHDEFGTLYRVTSKGYCHYVGA